MAIERFTIDIPQSQLDDLNLRLKIPGGLAGQLKKPGKGTPVNFMKPLVEYWREAFNWRKQEAELNRFAHYRSEVDGYPIHFIHMRGKGPRLFP